MQETPETMAQVAQEALAVMLETQEALVMQETRETMAQVAQEALAVMLETQEALVV
jgi:hypothetical protein